MVEDHMIDGLWNEWLDKKCPVVTLGDESISNRERYENILDFMEMAFYAGFEAELTYSSQEQLVRRWARDKGYIITKHTGSEEEASYSWYKISDPSIKGEARSVSKVATAVFNNLTNN